MYLIQFSNTISAFILAWRIGDAFFLKTQKNKNNLERKKRNEKISFKKYDYAIFTKMLLLCIYQFRTKINKIMVKNTFLIVLYKIFLRVSVLLIAIPSHIVFWTCENVFELLKMHCELKATI